MICGETILKHCMGIPFASSNFDNDFYDRVTTRVQGIFINCTEECRVQMNLTFLYTVQYM